MKSEQSVTSIPRYSYFSVVMAAVVLLVSVTKKKEVSFLFRFFRFYLFLFITIKATPLLSWPLQQQYFSPRTARPITGCKKRVLGRVAHTETKDDAREDK